MKLLQIAFIAILGATCVATYATSETLHSACVAAEQDVNPAPKQG